MFILCKLTLIIATAFVLCVPLFSQDAETRIAAIAEKKMAVEEIAMPITPKEIAMPITTIEIQ